MSQKIRLQDEYDWFSLFLDTEDFDDSEYMDPSDLPLSQELIKDILDWEETFNAQIDRQIGQNSGFKTDQEQKAFDARGPVFARRLQAELGSEYEVYYQQEPVFVTMASSQ